MGKLVDMSKVAKLGGMARAKKLSWEKLRAIAQQGGLAARGKKRKPYRKRKKIPNETQMINELLVTLHDHLADGGKIYPRTPVGKGSETVSQRVAELIRMSKQKKKT